MMVWTAYVKQDGDDLVLPLPAEAMIELGWRIGDILVWEVREDGTVTLTKKTRWYQRVIRYVKEFKWRK